MDSQHNLSKRPPVEKGIRTIAEGPFAFVHPVDCLSQLEKKCMNIFTYNFTANDHHIVQEGTKSKKGVKFSLFGRLPNAGRQVFLGEAVTRKRNVMRGRDQVLQDVCKNLFEYCHVVKPNPTYYNNGQVPDFLKHGKPCHHEPPVYKVLKKADTGPLSAKLCRTILDSFLHEPHEDLFFHDSNYSAQEKGILKGVAGAKSMKNKLLLRQYGYGQRVTIQSTYICIYKKRVGIDIFNEVKYKRNGHHPKYIICERSGAQQIANNMILETDKESKKGVNPELATDNAEIDSPIRGTAFIDQPNSGLEPPPAQDQQLGKRPFADIDQPIQGLQPPIAEIPPSCKRPCLDGDQPSEGLQLQDSLHLPSVKATCSGQPTQADNKQCTLTDQPSPSLQPPSVHQAYIHTPLEL